MSKSQDLTPLLECARKVITDELDILKQFLSRIRALGN